MNWFDDLAVSSVKPYANRPGSGVLVPLPSVHAGRMRSGSRVALDKDVRWSQHVRHRVDDEPGGYVPRRDSSDGGRPRLVPAQTAVQPFSTATPAATGC